MKCEMVNFSIVSCGFHRIHKFFGNWMQTGIFYSEMLKKERYQLLLEKLTNAPPAGSGFLTNTHQLGKCNLLLVRQQG